MDREDIRRVLSYPSLNLVHLALELVNLKDVERNVIDLVDIRGYTQEQTATKLDCSVKTVQNHRNKAFNKMSKCWKNDIAIKKLLE